MVKIIVDKKEDIASVVEKILMSRASEVTLVVPKNARIGESVANFHLLKREVEAAGKHLAVESVDDEILALAKASRIAGSHSLFKEKSQQSFSDIVKDGKHGKTMAKHSDAEKAEEIKMEEKLEKEAVLFAPIKHAEDYVDDAEFPPPPKRESRAFGGKPRGILIAAILLVLAGGGLWGLETAMGRVDINISLPKQPFSYSGSITADKAASKTDSASRVIPGELFVMDKNTVQLFPASGKKMVSLKAMGTIVIFNAYDSKPQLLVATTRFMTPDGKIFRLDQAVTVPGAIIQNGKIIPSSVKAAITADKPGVEYNIGPTSKMTVPGFKGSPRYNGFYAMIENPTEGGLVGEAAVPLDQDISAAKDKMSELLKVAVDGSASRTIPPQFKILDGASNFEIVKISPSAAADANGKFSVFGEAREAAVGFREEDVKSVLSQGAQNSSTPLVFDGLNVKYSNPVPDFEHGKLTFNVDATGFLAPPFDAANFKQQIKGESVEKVRADLAGMKNQIKVAEISVWPWWLGSIPQNTDRIHITVQ